MLYLEQLNSTVTKLVLAWETALRKVSGYYYKFGGTSFSSLMTSAFSFNAMLSKAACVKVNLHTLQEISQWQFDPRGCLSREYFTVTTFNPQTVSKSSAES